MEGPGSPPVRGDLTCSMPPERICPIAAHEAADRTDAVPGRGRGRPARLPIHPRRPRAAGPPGRPDLEGRPGAGRRRRRRAPRPAPEADPRGIAPPPGLPGPADRGERGPPEGPRVALARRAPARDEPAPPPHTPRGAIEGPDGRVRGEDLPPADRRGRPFADARRAPRPSTGRPATRATRSPRSGPGGSSKGFRNRVFNDEDLRKIDLASDRPDRVNLRLVDVYVQSLSGRSPEELETFVDRATAEGDANACVAAFFLARREPAGPRLRWVRKVLSGLPEFPDAALGDAPDPGGRVAGRGGRGGAGPGRVRRRAGPTPRSTSAGWRPRATPSSTGPPGSRRSPWPGRARRSAWPWSGGECSKRAISTRSPGPSRADRGRPAGRPG